MQAHYDRAGSGANRVSILNMYLYVMGRAPLPASVLNFTPTMMLPGLLEGGNEVGYGKTRSEAYTNNTVWGFFADVVDMIIDFCLQH